MSSTVTASLLGRALCLVVAGSGLGLAVNAARPDGVRFASFAPPTTCGAGEASVAGAASGAASGAPSGAPSGASPVEVLAPASASSVCGDAQTLVADVRPAPEFAEGHVTGAIHLPCASSVSAAGAAIDRLAGHHTLVVYGDGTEDAKLVADELRRRGGRPDLRIVVIEGGFPAWNRAGLACSSGPCLDCQAPRSTGGSHE